MHHRAAPQKQKGVVLFIAMIALVVLMIAAVALIRSTDTSQMIAGNLAVKRDLAHESEQAIQAALANFTGTGTLKNENARLADVSSANYSASVLPSNAMGIPNALLQVAATGESAAYNTGVTYRYMIDRLCPASGIPNNCQSCSAVDSSFISDIDALKNAGKGLGTRDLGATYRISVRLTDSRGTQSFFQSTFCSVGS